MAIYTSSYSSPFVVILLCTFVLSGTFGLWYPWFATVQQHPQLSIRPVQNSHVDGSTGDDADASIKSPTVNLVVASIKAENTSWVWDLAPEWNKMIYIVDDPDANLTVPMNKGHEVMVYLTYLIDHYTTLPDITLFSHANRYQWHNDDPLCDGARVLYRLKTTHIQTTGYASLRCNWLYGCPEWVRPVADANASDPYWKSQYKDVFETLLPGERVPEVVGAPCCAQFGVTRLRVLQRPVEAYARMRDWLVATDMDTGYVGRIFERMWHVIFGQAAVFCPPAPQCYCDTFGLCQLECENEGECLSHYTPPDFWDMPEGWPEFDEKGDPQDTTNNEVVT